MDTSFAISTSALRTTTTRQDVVSHDVANINTKGFEESRVLQSDNNPGVRVADIQKTANTNPTNMSNTKFETEAKEMIENKNTYSANASVIKVQNRMVGELLDLVG